MECEYHVPTHIVYAELTSDLCNSERGLQQPGLEKALNRLDPGNLFGASSDLQAVAS